jgi:HPr kinase/phosphorylase
MKTITVEDLLEHRDGGLEFAVLAGREGLANAIESARIQKQGLVLTGMTEAVRDGRIQILGSTELDYLARCDEGARKLAAETLANSPAAAVVITRGLPCPEALKVACDRAGKPVLGCRQPSSKLIEDLQATLEKELAPSTSLHGVLVDILGLGILLLGKSGIGKSECALSLVARGHRLVADDVVEVQRRGRLLFGSGVEVMRHLLEIRGLGIVDVKDLYGVGAVREHKRIELVVELAAWREGMQVDRLGLDVKWYQLLELELPYITIPVRPGRDLATMIEVAARNELLRHSKVHSAREFQQRLERQAERNYLRTTRLQDIE